MYTRSCDTSLIYNTCIDKLYLYMCPLQKCQSHRSNYNSVCRNYVTRINNRYICIRECLLGSNFKPFCTFEFLNNLRKANISV